MNRPHQKTDIIQMIHKRSTALEYVSKVHTDIIGSTELRYDKIFLCFLLKLLLYASRAYMAVSIHISLETEIWPSHEVIVHIAYGQ